MSFNRSQYIKHSPSRSLLPSAPSPSEPLVILHSWYPRAHLGQGDLSPHHFGRRTVRATSKHDLPQEIPARQRRRNQWEKPQCWGDAVVRYGEREALCRGYRAPSSIIPQDRSITSLWDRETAAHLFLLAAQLLGPADRRAGSFVRDKI